ncbi:MAG: type II toxin-antitoxin system RelE/ParE family toxin [Gammaproteobacteria bacterium]|nr:type II toxin-antitoxin system RelE/ParE family toxin [Gammaproteobacteria bacterium]
MPQVRFLPAALRDLERLCKFLRPKNPAAAKRAAVAITKTVQMLGQPPQIGRSSEEIGLEYRELPVSFGDSGYVVRFRHENDLVTVLALRHQREVGY